MIPVSIFRVLLVLFVVSGILVLTDAALANLGVRGHLANFFSGLLAGGMVFFLAYEWGRVLRFCGKGIVKAGLDEKTIRDELRALGLSDERVRVSVLDSQDFHGATVREGGSHRMFISSRFLREFSPSALRGLLAHEHGHIENAHPIKLAMLLGLIASVKLSVGIPLGAVVAILLSYLFMLREWEYIADESALRRAGPESLLAAFREYQAAAGDKDMSRFSEFFCGHPSLHRRIAAVHRLEGK